jgi:hypothetical protein
MTKSPKAPKAPTKADLANKALVAEGVKVRTAQAGSELNLVLKFADLMESGKLSNAGAELTLKAIQDSAGEFAEIKMSHVPHFRTMAKLHAQDSTLTRVKGLYTLCDRMARGVEKVAGQTKADTARAIVDSGKLSTAQLMDKVPSVQSAGKGEGNKNSKVEGVSLKIENLDSLAKLVGMLDASTMTTGDPLFIALQNLAKALKAKGINA